jgi:hypothetical protein
MSFQPYFVAYARAHGRTPEAQLDADRAAWRGGCMSGFILWIAAAKARFRKLHPEACLPNGDILDSAAWGRYLDTLSRKATP